MYVLTEITFLPQKAWVVSSATCAEALFAVLHTTCRPNYAMPCSCRGATRPEWQRALPITVPLIEPFFLHSVSLLSIFPPPFFLFLLVHQCSCMVLIVAAMQHGSPPEVWRQGSGRRGWYVLCCQWAVCLLGLILVQSTGLYFQDLFETWMVSNITLIAWSTISHIDRSRFIRALNEMLPTDNWKVKIIILGWYFH